MTSRPFHASTRAFRVSKESMQSSDYILAKKQKILQCTDVKCSPPPSLNIANLGVNLVTKLDLTNVSVIVQNSTMKAPAKLSITSVPFLDYTIDAKGELFGNTLCGVNNFQHYLEENH